MRNALIAATAALLTIHAASAAPSAPQRVRGVIESWQPATHILTVKTDSGASDPVTLLPDARIIGNEKATLEDIKQGDFVASAAMQAPDGKLYAQELRIFPDSMRGMGEGHYAMSQPNQTMTNATVVEVQGASSTAGKSGTVNVTFHGTQMENGTCEGHASGPGKGTCVGTTALVIPPNIPVTRWVLGTPDWLKPGMAVTMFVSPARDGKLESHGLVVEHNGIKPHI